MTTVRSILLAAWLCTAFTACGESPAGVQQRHIDQFVERTGIVIPAAAKATDYQHLPSMDGWLHLRLRMPRDQVTTFLSESGLSDLLEKTRTEASAVLAIYDGLIETTPDDYIEGQKSLDDGFFLNVLVNNDDPAWSIVYLVWFGT